MSSPEVQAAFCAVLCDEWARAGVTDAVVAPGSRSTPLVAALDQEPRIRLSVVLDERSAGFMALGLGLATGRPAVVVTTSGTASVELHPAVVEAGQAGVPLLAVTTDRPPELHQVGAPQTVEQAGLFAAAVRWACDPGVAEAGSAAMWRSLASRAVAEAVAGPAGPGPVHLNLPFREPLLGRPDPAVMPPGRPDGAAWHQIVATDPGTPAASLAGWIGSLAGRRGLIVVGGGAASQSDGGRAVLALAEHLGWPVLADPRSGCRIRHDLVVSAADPLLRTATMAAAVPEVVLRIGAPWASKVLNQWLVALPADVPQVVLDPWGRWADPERTAWHVSRTSASGLLAALPAPASPDPARNGWVASWAEAERTARAVIDHLLAADGPLALSEPAVGHAALGSLPPGATLLTSSSMPVRDVEWYGPPTDRVEVLANRGANGIDGVVSTALGVALARPDRPVTGLLGDLAFLYDAGALLWATGRPVHLRLVVVDNDGGGIFSFLPQADALPTERFERYWGTPHGLDLAAVARAYGVAAETITDRHRLDRFLSSSGTGVRVAVVRSDRAANVTAHERIHREVAEAVDDRLRGGPERPAGPGA